MADFFTVGESFTYYQDRTYTVVPTAASTQNAITFATFGFEGALGITICNGNSSCGPFSAHKHYAGDDYVNFIAHTDLDVYAMYDTRGGVNPVDTSEDAPWLAAAGFVDTGYFIETTDAVGLYTVYKNTYLQGQTVALHGNRKGVTDFAINTNYWVIMKEAGDASATPAEQLCVASPLNSPPTAVDDVFTIPKRNPNHDCSGLRCTHFLSPIDNDSDPDGDFPIVIAANGAGQLIPSSTGNATVQVGAVDGPWIVFYKPNLGFTGTDVFPYTISDQNGGTATGMITVNVINRPPVAMDDVFTIPERNPSCSGLGCTHFLSAIDNDSDPDGDFPIIIAANGAGQLIESSTGNATVKVAEADGPWVVFYTPDIGFTGTDVFPYTISDQNGGTDTATVTVNVTQAFATSQ